MSRAFHCLCTDFSLLKYPMDTLLGCVFPPGMVPAEDPVGAQVLEVRTWVGGDHSRPMG